MNSKLRSFGSAWRISLLSIILFYSQVSAQDSLHTLPGDRAKQKDTTSLALSGKLVSLTVTDNNSYKVYPYNKKRVKLVAAGNILGYGGSMVGLYSAWYSGYPQTSFHFFNDNREWQQVDKMGHAYAAYVESFGSMEMWRWAGLNRKQQIWLGGMSGAAYQTMIEILDAYSVGWGWSWGDFAANVAGSGMLIAQELAWNDQRIRFKFSFHNKNYGEDQLNKRADELYGSGISQRFLKDYNGQTYWLSANINSFIPKSRLPRWLNIAVGYGADGMFGGEENIAKDKFGNITFDRRDIKRYRQFFIAPDIDLTKIRTKNRVVKTALGVLNVFKFPLPSLEYNTLGKFKVNFVHF